MKEGPATALLVLTAATLFCLAACFRPTDPTPDIEATVQAAVAMAIPSPTPTSTPDAEATIAAKVRSTVEAMAPSPTSTPVPTATATPTATLTPIPTSTPTATPTSTPTPIPTSTPTPTPTNTPTPIPTSTPTPTPTPTSTPTPIPTNTPTPAPTSTPTPTPDTAQSMADVVERSRAGVVLIAATSGSGSGFVVDPAGYILTNEHVIAGAGRLTVVLDDGTRLTPQVVAFDAERDIALLRVETTRQLTALPLATEVREGDEVVALGYPLDLQDSDDHNAGHSLRVPHVQGSGLHSDGRGHQPGQQRRAAAEPERRSRRHEHVRTPGDSGTRLRRPGNRLRDQIRRAVQPPGDIEVGRICRRDRRRLARRPRRRARRGTPSAR